MESLWNPNGIIMESQWNHNITPVESQIHFFRIQHLFSNNPNGIRHLFSNNPKISDGNIWNPRAYIRLWKFTSWFTVETEGSAPASVRCFAPHPALRSDPRARRRAQTPFSMLPTHREKNVQLSARKSELSAKSTLSAKKTSLSI